MICNAGEWVCREFLLAVDLTVAVFRYTEVMSHVSRGGEDLSSVYSKFIKDRAEVEREYAKNLRKLVSKYNDKTDTGRKSKETSQAKGFR